MDWVSMHVLQLFGRLGLSVYVEVIITALPELLFSAMFEFSGSLLFQNLQRDCQGRDAGFPGKKMHMLWHEHVSGDDKTISLPHPFQFMLKSGVCTVRLQQRLSSMTTEGNKMELS